jgi:starvation-inducible DNA-binding protein
MKNLEVAIKTAAATVFGFYLKVHYFHLNSTGPNFYEYHKLTDKIWKDVIDSFDGISEEIRALDMMAPASLLEFQQLSLLEDFTGTGEARAMLYELLLDNDKVIEVLTEANTLAGPHPGLQNFLEGRIDAHEKVGWMIRSIVQGK